MAFTTQEQMIQTKPTRIKTKIISDQTTDNLILGIILIGSDFPDTFTSFLKLYFFF